MRPATAIRVLLGLCIILAVVAAAYAGSGDNPPPASLEFPTQHVIDQTAVTEGFPTVRADSNEAQVTGLLCNLSDAPIATEVEIFLERPGGPKIPLLDRSLTQIREPGCEAHDTAEVCAGRLDRIDSPAPVTVCLPPFTNPITHALTDHLDPYPWFITIEVHVTDGTAADSVATTAPFQINPPVPSRPDR